MIVIAQMKHETNTFSPVPTPLARFTRTGERPLEGDAAIRAFRGTGTGLGALIAVVEDAGLPYSLPIAASAWPSGPVDDDAFEYVAGCIVAAVADGCDAVLLDLHGAMVTQSHDDGEGELLRRIRAVAPHIPIGVVLDMHTNLSAAMADAATVISGYHTYPHVDMHESGVRVGKAILATLNATITPTTAYGFRAMLPHIMRQASLDQPNRAIQAHAAEMERTGAITASLFTGFPHADNPHAGVSAVVVTDGDAALARRYCDELLEMAWQTREAFVYHVEPLAQSLARAAAMPASGRPVVLLDHYDNTSSGGTMDTMAVLKGIIEARLENVAAFAIYDPDAVATAQHAGVGATITLALGGHADMPAIGVGAKPYSITARVARIVEGRYRNHGPMSRGEQVDMGLCAVLDTGHVEIAVISRRVEPHDMASFEVLGIDPLSKRYLMLKSRVHWRAGLGDLAQAVVECAGEGVCTSDYTQLPFHRLRRPMYPLEREHAMPVQGET
jgi:microcystin degradation protein MlrC